MRTRYALGLMALAAGLWVGVVDSAYAQKGGKGGGGGGRSGGGGASRSAPAGRSAPSFSGPSRSAPAIRSAPARSAPAVRSAPAKSFSGANKSAPPVIRSTTASPKANPAKANPAKAGTVTNGTPRFDPAVRPATATAPAKNFGPNSNKNVGPNKAGNVVKSGPNAGKPNVVRNANSDRFNGSRWNDPRWNNYNRYYWDRDRWHGGYYGYHHHHRHSFWPFFAYAAISDWIGYRPFGWNYWGYYPYAGYYWQPEIIYVDNSAPVIVDVSDASATIEVRLPDPDAAVWIDDVETESRGTERRYFTPTLRAGSSYSYTIKASWTDDGETRTIERQVPLQAGSRVLLDFTESPSRLVVNPARE